MSELIEIHGQQWKLSDIQEDIEWSKKQKWEHKKYEKTNDHDHCIICCWTIFDSENEIDGFGYFLRGSTWLCTECYNKFL